MNKIYLLLVCCLMNLGASAVSTYYPISVSAPYGGASPSGVCQNSKNTVTTVTYTNCSTPSGVGALTVTATWYLNGALVYTDGPHTIAAGGGTISLPAGVITYTASGTQPLNCVLSWTGASPVACGSLTSVTGASTNINVNSTPGPILGTPAVCTGYTDTLTNDTATGIWSSSSANASVSFSSGIVTGNTAGTARITYTLGDGCYSTALFTVNQTPAAITGLFSVCTGTLTTLHDATAGGTWSSTYDTVATIGPATSSLTAVDTGVTTISYVMSTGCMTVSTLTVNQTPTIITGPTQVCSASSITLSDSLVGGAWTSGAAGTASVVYNTGVVTGVAASGTARITYTMPSGCIATIVVTVEPLPAAISGASAVCVSSLITFSDATTGGVWSSSNTTLGTAGSGSGFDETGLTSGVDTIYYTLTATGCARSKIVTVNPLPAAISSPGAMCAGLTTTLTDASTGGTWTSSATGVATIVAATGATTAVGTGVTNITYKLPTGCLITTPLTVNPVPAAISGATTLCVGYLTTFSDATGGGVWSSSNTFVAFIGTAGIAGGAGPGTSTISYTLPATGCAKAVVLTVNNVPANISGTDSLCVGGTTTLTDITAGGTWSSSSTAIATVSTAGVVTGVSFGVVTISYKVSTGCYVTFPITINPNPAAIAGTARVCAGSTTLLSDASAGGTWSSSIAAAGTVDASGNVTGIAAGTTNITYTLATGGCIISRQVTVNPLPAPISGVNAVCAGSTITMSDITPTGTWSSTNTGIATVSGAGVVTGVLAGTDSIRYTVTATGCSNFASVTVNPLPTVINGTPVVCVGSTTLLTDNTAGGIWTSSNTARATVGTDGTVTGTGAGTVTISYALGTGCQKTLLVTVNALPAPITGITTVCVNSATTLSDATAGGTWTTSDGTVAGVTGAGATGTVTGVGIGSANITYTLGTGCYRTDLVTVNPLPSAISGTETVCIGLSTTLTDVDGGGIWTSGSTGVATVGFSTGTVNGVTAGTSNITYTLTTGCKTISVVTVNPLPVIISGPTSVCINSSITLTDGTAGGTWSSANPGIGSIGAGTGVVVGVSAGTVTISYVLATGCLRTTAINVNALPTAIAGADTVCVGSTTALSDGLPGGTWASNTPAVATAALTTGVISGVAAGTTTITYTLSTGCNTYMIMTVDALPTAITGATSVCVNQTITLSDGAFIGTWSSSNASVASIDPVSGILTGNAAGVVTVSFTLGTGCYKTTTITVHGLPGAITGATTVCMGSTTGLADGTPGGTWSSSFLPVASVGSSTGLVTPASQGTATITYKITSTGCYTNTDVTVNPVPATIDGVLNVCSGSSVTLTDATPGGAWSSSNSSIALIDPTTGMVTGELAGSVTITYILGTGCKATIPFLVNALPAPITGTTYVCVNATTVLHDVTAGGTWSSSDITVATVSGGAVLGIDSGIATISYVPATGCVASIIVTVNPIPGPITGRLTACTGDTTMLADSVSGGEWTSGNTSVATAGTLSGIITGVSAGSAVISYTLGTGCVTTKLIQVYTSPAAIAGANNVCEGALMILSDAVTGGTWNSADITVATVGAADGHVVGQSISGPVLISYTTSGLCTITKTINVNITPPAIAGTYSVCSASVDSLTDGITGGTWSSSNTSVATVGISTGYVTGVTGGTTHITYTLGTGCYVANSFTVSTTPVAITGPANVCQNLTVALSDATGGGVWTTSDATVAAVNGSTGVVTGGFSGSATISYTVGSGCGVAIIMNTNPAPPNITGSISLCTGSTTQLSDASGGGAWTSSNTVGAPIDVTGVVTGINVGTASITYKLLATGCLTSSVVTVNPVPAAITGPSVVCMGSNITLSDTSSVTTGIWSSSNILVATIGSGTGILSGVDTGYTTVTYTVGTGCYNTALIRVNWTPGPITGGNIVCEGSVLSLSDATTFGTWSSSDTSTGVINPVTGNVTGMSAGTTTITYLEGTGCYITEQVTVNPLPATIVGAPIVCVGSSVFLSDATSGGTWTSTNATATIDGFGDVTGVAPGTDTLVYTITATGCLMTHFISVDAVPTPITGANVLCVGSIDTLTSTPLGGLWTSSDTSKATVGEANGLALGQSAGVVIITYSALSGCQAFLTITVNPVPAPITGIDNLCPGGSTTLFDVTGGGVWSSTNSLNASVGTDGTVTAIAQGTTATISYTLTSDHCAATLVFSVNPLPYVGTIQGTKIFCMTSSSTLTDSVAAGIWSSSDPAIVSINGSTGLATGVAVGTATISYIVTEQCGMDTATAVIQINPLPFATPILGFPQMCIHANTNLYDSVAGGVWTSADTAIVTIDPLTGVAYGVAPGSATISYTYTNFCGSYSATTVVTVNGTFAFARIATYPDTPMCSNVMYQNFGALLPAPSGIAYHWSVSPNAVLFTDSAFSTQQYAIVSFPTSGTVVVKLSAEITSSGCAIADSFVTTIGSGVATNPGVQYYLNEFVCIDNTQDTYQWGYDDILTLDSTLLVGETTQDYFNGTPDTARKNYWCITTKNGCTQKSYYEFNRTSAVTNVAANDLDVLLFPNPANSVVNIQVKGSLAAGDEVSVKLMDMLGKEIETSLLDNGRGTIQVSTLPSGVYSVLLSRNGVKIASKIFVKN